MTKSYIGCHASISGGAIKGIQYVNQDLKGNAVQIFLGSSHSGSLKMKTKFTDDELAEIKKYCKDNDVFLVAHGAYVLNFSKHKPTSGAIQYAIDNLAHDLDISSKMGALGVVIHMGYKLDNDEEEAYQNFVGCVSKAIDNTPKGSLVILETAAGQGTQIATSLEDFAKLYHLFPNKYKKRLGICIDTCHTFSAGENISSLEGVKDFLNRFDKLIGSKNLVLFHINDSKQQLNSRKDQHQGIGFGYIYDSNKGGDLNALKYLTQYATKHNVPMILETHGGASKKGTEKNEGSFSEEINLLKAFSKGTTDSMKVWESKLDNAEKSKKKTKKSKSKTKPKSK